MRRPTSAPPRFAAIALAAVLLVGATAAQAMATCYTVYDRNGEIVYRAFTPPFDGASDFTSAGRQQLRTRSENLVFFPADFCVPVASVGGIGGRSYTTAEIVAAFPGYAVRPDGSTIGSPYGAMPTGATPAAAPAGTAQ